eukprot:CAMPEP_0118706776 /NCGR_PEP_ID=MMETSP0800-20121206/20775_1 /TAXON_ID=210618 ORGANISM="Striatella unipunctata, Strain CCMP2910" /NCGR_SAMPLE_ID=MMETSP0800 /ASSEMBLY_ACC=CAM_ASM_000638 /LENGTH=216 /DNA_ID=CAMNT_0006609407 /DNA_START=75 /DNA_END=725 /DNA_ORIENTATION=+
MARRHASLDIPRVRDAISTTNVNVNVNNNNNNNAIIEGQKPTIPLGIEVDNIWLSEFLCFVRSDLLEVFQNNPDDVLCSQRISKTNLKSGQVGIRCKFCCHCNPRRREARSSSFPSSLSRLYQSLSMMLRDHFPNCTEIPQELRTKFNTLKSKTSPAGVGESKQYWISSAMEIGLKDTEGGGIGIDEKKWAATLERVQRRHKQQQQQQLGGNRKSL